jgi:hypothetical protein
LVKYCPLIESGFQSAEHRLAALLLLRLIRKEIAKDVLYECLVLRIIKISRSGIFIGTQYAIAILSFLRRMKWDFLKS